MKAQIMGLTFLVASSAQAFTGLQVIEAGKQALAQAVFEVDQESIEAFQTISGEDEMEVEVLYHDEANEVDEVLAYGCHLHGAQVACHEEGHVDHKTLSFGDFYESYTISTNSFVQVVAQLGANLDDLVGVKAWKLTGHDHDHDDKEDHEEEGEVWVKYDYLSNGQVNSVFSMCHHHGGGPVIDCHWTFAGEGEPQF